MRKIRFGVIGTGRIASQFVQEAAVSEYIEVVNVCARDLEKTQAFAKEYGIPANSADATAMLADPTIDAVYVGTLHTTHYPYTIQALEAGKHVLCEKPATITSKQLHHVIEVAKAANKLFMEAMTVGLNPTYLAIKQLIAEGVIGTVTHVESSMGAISSKAHKHTPELAGGCIYDIGIYNLFFQYDLLGPVVRMQSQAKMHREWDVVGTVQLLSEHVNGAQSYAFMTMDALSTGRAAIIGTKGTIELAKGWTMGSSYTVTTIDGNVTTYEVNPTRWLGYETDHFAQLIHEGKTESPIMTHNASMALQTMIEHIYKQEEIFLPREITK